MNPRATGVKRPPAFQSPLWAHYERIKTWRKAGLFWHVIQERLKADYELERTPSAILIFFKNAQKRVEKGRMPLGFETRESKKPARKKTHPEFDSAALGIDPQDHAIFSRFKPPAKHE